MEISSDEDLPPNLTPPSTVLEVHIAVLYVLFNNLYDDIILIIIKFIEPKKHIPFRITILLKKKKKLIFFIVSPNTIHAKRVLIFKNNDSSSFLSCILA